MDTDEHGSYHVRTSENPESRDQNAELRKRRASTADDGTVTPTLMEWSCLRLENGDPRCQTDAAEARPE